MQTVSQEGHSHNQGVQLTVAACVFTSKEKTSVCVANENKELRS